MSGLLTHKPHGRRFNTTRALLYATQQRKITALRMALEIIALSRGPGRLASEDYFTQGAWCPGLTWAERKAFVGARVTRALNQSLNPPVEATGVIPGHDKIAASNGFEAAGLPQPRTLAVAGGQAPGAGLRWLDGPAAILAFLREPGTLPCFGKPVFGTVGLGAASLEAIDGSRVLLGSGKWVEADALVQEIMRDHAQGYIFQELVRPHPSLAALIGPVIGTLRVVTVDAGSGPEPLYVVLKTPAPGGMVDSIAGPLGLFAAVDTVSGRVLRLQDRRQIGGTDLAVFPQTAAPVAGASLPDFSAALQIAVAAHASIAGQGLFGVDVLLSDRGPLLNEVNSNPQHALYQTAFARGLLNPDLLPKLRAVRARFRQTTPKPKFAPLP